jgi:multiple sugar transport system substrate-binding protein
MALLKGITWNHPRGYQPLRAASALWKKESGVDLEWDIRTLKEFGDYPIEKLTGLYDLLIIDHPYTGSAAANKLLLPLDDRLPAPFIETQRQQSIGGGFGSYRYNDVCWALPIDAAAQVSACRKDLATKMNWTLPAAITGLKDAAAALPQNVFIGVPLCATDIWCVFLSLCAMYSKGNFFAEDGIDPVTGEWALEQIRSWKDFLHQSSFSMNPVQMLDRMSTADDIVYVPLTFGYSNYARRGRKEKLIHFCDPPVQHAGLPTSLMGGAGLAISSKTKQPAECLTFMQYILSEEIQRGLYYREQGQPAHLAAWLDPDNNRDCSGFFSDTLQTMRNAYVRPRVKSFNRFQEAAADYIHELVTGKDPLVRPLAKLNTMYKTIVNG